MTISRIFKIFTNRKLQIFWTFSEVSNFRNKDYISKIWKVPNISKSGKFWKFPNLKSFESFQIWKFLKFSYFESFELIESFENSEIFYFENFKLIKSFENFDHFWKNTFRKFQICQKLRICQNILKNYISKLSCLSKVSKMSKKINFLYFGSLKILEVWKNGVNNGVVNFFKGQNSIFIWNWGWEVKVGGAWYISKKSGRCGFGPLDRFKKFISFFSYRICFSSG